MGHWVVPAKVIWVVLGIQGQKSNGRRDLASKDGVSGRQSSKCGVDLRRSPFCDKRIFSPTKWDMHPLFKASHMHTIQASPGLICHVWNS